MKIQSNMFFAGILINSLKIDQLEKKWAARCLFLLVIAISICSNLWPAGDPDFSKFTEWAGSFSNTSDMYASLLSSNNTAFSIISIGNIIYYLFSLVIIFVYVFIGLLYSRIYVGDKSGQKLGQSCIAYLKYLPILIVFFIMILIPASFLLVIPVVFVFIIPALYFSPIIITHEKKNPVDALILSYQYTKGVKFSICWNLFMLYIIYQLPQALIISIFPENSNVDTFLYSFFTAFFVLAMGRLNGIFYDRLRIHPVVQKTGPMNGL